MSKLESIRYKRGHLEILDQLKIPREHLYIDIKNTGQGKWPEPLISTCLFGANSYILSLEWRQSLC